MSFDPSEKVSQRAPSGSTLTFGCSRPDFEVGIRVPFGGVPNLGQRPYEFGPTLTIRKQYSHPPFRIFFLNQGPV